MDRGAWRATVHGIAKSWTWLKWLARTNCTKLMFNKKLAKCSVNSIYCMHAGHSEGRKGPGSWWRLLRRKAHSRCFQHQHAISAWELGSGSVRISCFISLWVGGVPSNKQFDLGADGQAHGSLGMMAEPHDRLMVAAQKQPLWANLGESAVRMSTVWPHLLYCRAASSLKTSGGPSCSPAVQLSRGKRVLRWQAVHLRAVKGITRYTASLWKLDKCDLGDARS